MYSTGWGGKSIRLWRLPKGICCVCRRFAPPSLSNLQSHYLQGTQALPVYCSMKMLTRPCLTSYSVVHSPSDTHPQYHTPTLHAVTHCVPPLKRLHLCLMTGEKAKSFTLLGTQISHDTSWQNSVHTHPTQPVNHSYTKTHTHPK